MSGVLRYLIDTNVLSDLARQPDGRTARRLLEVGADRVGTSIVVACEIRFGLAKSASPRLVERMTQLLEQFDPLPLEPPVDQHYAAIRMELERSGTPIGPNDLLIAAHALALDLTLVSANGREFARVPGLRLEDWRSRRGQVLY